MPNVTFLLLDGFSNMVLSCLLEPLRAVRDQAQEDLDWCVVTADARPARSSSGLSIAADCSASESPDGDLLVVVAGYRFRQHAADPQVLRCLRELTRRHALVLGADTGAWILASAGLLDEQPATIHWAVQRDFAETFPNVSFSDQRFVSLGRIWSSGGASTSLDLILEYIGTRFGPAEAFMASTMFLHDAKLDQLPEPATGRLSARGSAKLRHVVNLMAETIETPQSLAQLAARAGLSTRTLDRLFQSQLGLSPGRYYQTMRLSHARDLASSTDYGLREIALRCGYSDAPALSRAFRLAYGYPIGQVRPTVT